MNESTLAWAGRRILVVEDDVEVSRAIAHILSDLGHNPIICNHAEEAFSLIRSQQFDLLLIDYRMPEMTGLDLIVMLRQECCNVPVIMMTGYPATEERVSSQSLGVFAILKKPLSSEQLAGVVDEVFAKAGGSLELNSGRSGKI